MRTPLVLILVLLAIFVAPHYSPNAHAETSFSFGAAGDYGYTSNSNAAQALFIKMGQSGLGFALALGDLSYGETSPDTWCGSFKLSVSNLEVMTGNHDSGETSNPNPGDNLNFFDTPNALVSPGRQRYCHFTLPGATPITGLEGMEYYFDYPATGPLVRIISVSAGITFQTPVLNNTQGSSIHLGPSGCNLGPGCYNVWSGLKWAYLATTNTNQELDHYNWVSNAIDSARTAGVPFVFLTMHKNCLTTGGGASSHITCESGSDVMNLAISKKVDLYITGHEHNYERSKQLAFNGSTCTAIQLGAYNSACVVNSVNPFIKGAGTIILTIGTGGEGMSSYGCNTGGNNQWSIPQYFLQCENTSFGFVKFDVTGTSLGASFIASTGTYADSFNIADFSMSANPTSNCQIPGSQTFSQITLTSLNAFAGTVRLSTNVSPVVSGGPTASLSSTSVTLSSGGSAVSTLYVNAGTATGSFTVSVTGSYSILSHLTQESITVASPSCPGGGGGGGSVAAGTLITLADGGEVAVQNLRVGMRLLSYDMTTRQFVNTTLTRLVTVVTYDQMVISTSSGKPLIVDQNPVQRVYVQLSDGTVALLSVTDLQVGYKLFQPVSQTWVSITNIQYQNGGRHIMYDIYNTSPGNYLANGYLDPQKEGSP